MTKFVWVASLAGVAAFAVGCSSGSAGAIGGDPIGTSSSRIIAGTASTSDQDAVILLAIHSGGVLRGTCTGTLVAPNLVLTARHCVSDTDEGALCTETGAPLSQGVVHGDRDPGDLYVYTGVDGVRNVSDTTRAAARGKTVVHEPVSNICNADLAFIVLDQSIQGRVAPIRVTGGVRPGEQLTAVGWGLTEAGDLPTTRQQRANVPVQYAGPTTLDPQNNIGLGDSEFLVGEAFCSGDSGGPSFSSKGAVVGVVSRGGGGTASANNDAASCVGQNVLNFYTHLSEKSALVAQAFMAAGAEPRTEGDAPGVGVGEACTTNLDCSSDACVHGKCERRCDDGTMCSASEICTPFETKKICTLAPDGPLPVTPPADGTAPAAAAPATSSTTTTTGCSAAPASGGAGRGCGAWLAFAAAAFFAVRRRRRSR